RRLRTQLRRLLNMVTNPRMVLFPVILGPERLARFKPFQRDLERVDGPIYEEIAERRLASDLADREDILSMLLQARHEDGSGMSDSELRDELVTLLVAGHETTATALAWAAERLCRHPEKLERLTHEVRAGETAYLDAVVTEPPRRRVRRVRDADRPARARAAARTCARTPAARAGLPTSDHRDPTTRRRGDRQMKRGMTRHEKQQRTRSSLLRAAAKVFCKRGLE